MCQIVRGRRLRPLLTQGKAIVLSTHADFEHSQTTRETFPRLKTSDLGLVTKGQVTQDK